MYENNQMDEWMMKITLWIRFFHSEIQSSDSKTYADFKKHNIFVSERHGENRLFLFCGQLQFKVIENGRNLSAV